MATKSSGMSRGCGEVSYDVWGSSGSRPVCRHGHAREKSLSEQEQVKAVTLRAAPGNGGHLGGFFLVVVFFW